MRSFVSTDPENHQSENTWFTPKKFIDTLGPFDLDPCSVSFRPFDTAKKHLEYDRGECGISTNWNGDVWLNPPYGKELEPFVNKFIEHKKGVCLIFSRMGNKHVQELINSGAYFYFLRKRVKFIKKDLSKSTNAGTDSCLVFFDEKWKPLVSKFEGILVKKGKE